MSRFQNSNKNDHASSGWSKGDVHQIQIKEILPTNKYYYVSVEEDGKQYWIAILNSHKIEIGQNYYYTGGLIKTQFESVELQRTFEELTLVKNIVPANHEHLGGQENQNKIQTSTFDFTRKPEAKAFKELVDNASEYQGKEVIIHGICTKVNNNIMGVNWIHLKDGTMDDYDFTVTSSIQAKVGQSYMLKGVLAVDKDFGAGYKYDVIVEKCEVVNGLN